MDIQDPAPDLFKLIFHKHYPSVIRKLTALLRDKAAAEDLAQEVFLKLYKNPPSTPEAVGAWLHRVLTRSAYDYLDQKARERSLMQRQERQLMAEPQSHQSGEQAVIKQGDEEQVHGWLNSLSERDREMLLLRYSGYSYSEIAQELQVQQPQVGTLLKRAGERLRKQALKHEKQWSHE
ncbi:sigma-70 family RNA polymerase sigma factor [Paenibacillus glycanilyticus]|uniref:sigma-70 family RNA polymerase sigma factor n=1 Tax=Paenibacillus glycanilyticus TaxID=126569 RepID=UPI00203EDAD8|nr:sigma-70 family RNA polymerase sigma factor [Paenibacillus glycanilyticus]MCM3628552.1 sigma-70 family RNA polymerase sigma factor [Paenibacillus glycanilyticus]